MATGLDGSFRPPTRPPAAHSSGEPTRLGALSSTAPPSSRTGTSWRTKSTIVASSLPLNANHPQRRVGTPGADASQFHQVLQSCIIPRAATTSRTSSAEARERQGLPNLTASTPYSALSCRVSNRSSILAPAGSQTHHLSHQQARHQLTPDPVRIPLTPPAAKGRHPHGPHRNLLQAGRQQAPQHLLSGRWSAE